MIATNSYNSNPLRSFRVIKDKISFKWKVFAQKRSQDLENLIHDSGTFYIYNTKKLLKFKKMLKATSFYNIDKFRSVDINTFQDLKFAEFLCKYKKFKK